MSQSNKVTQRSNQTDGSAQKEKPLGVTFQTGGVPGISLLDSMKSFMKIQYDTAAASVKKIKSGRANDGIDEDEEEEVKEGWKIDPESGLEVPMTDAEKKRKRLLREQEKLEQRIEDMENKNLIFPINYQMSEDNFGDVSSDDSLLHSTRLGSLTDGRSHRNRRENDQRDISKESVDYTETISITERQSNTLMNNSNSNFGLAQSIASKSPLNQSGVAFASKQPNFLNAQNKNQTLKIAVKPHLPDDDLLPTTAKAIDISTNMLDKDNSFDLQNQNNNAKLLTQPDLQPLKLDSTDKNEVQEKLEIPSHEVNDLMLDPVNIPGYDQLSVIVQTQLRALAKPRKQKTQQDIAKLMLSIQQVDFFKSKNLDEQTQTQVLASAGFSNTPKGKWVFKEGAHGNHMYILLHGKCNALILNKDFLEFRRLIRSNIKNLFDEIDTGLDIIKNLDHADPESGEEMTYLQNNIKQQKQILKLRRQIKKDVDKLKALKKFNKVKEYVAGDYFGELSMIYNQPRAASIAATKNSFFLTIHKDDYESHLKRHEKRQKEQVVEFFKNVSFLSELSNQTIVKMTYGFVLHRCLKKGETVLKEGDPVTHIALVKDGEFDVVKSNLRGLDQKILGFLKKGDIRTKLAKQVLLLPGRTTIYQKTHQLIPPFEKSKDDSSFLHDSSVDVEQIAFNSVSDKLTEIAREQTENQKKNLSSLNSLNKTSLSRYKDIRISINGTGYAFGDYDAFTNQPCYQYNLVASRAGSTCYLIEKADFIKFTNAYKKIFKAVKGSVYEKDLNMMRQLTRIVFSRWYTDMLQENLRVVPDLDPSPTNGQSLNKKKDKDLLQAYKAENAMENNPNSVFNKPQAVAILRKPEVSLYNNDNARAIIQKSGSKQDMVLLHEHEANEFIKKKEKQEKAISLERQKNGYTQPEPHPVPTYWNQQTSQFEHRPGSERKNRPKEKIQSQMNTVMPMEIVRAQPFFSKQAHMLRDQIEEYVHGFPATKAHREIIEKQFNVKIQEPESTDKSRQTTMQAHYSLPKFSSKGTPNSPAKLLQQPKRPSQTDIASKKTTIDLKRMNQEYLVNMLVPDHDLPVDPERLKKAIKISLLKNDNNPDKVDIQGIMREQVRIHRHIQQYKTENKKQVKVSVSNNYFSSRIVKKIAEDHIHQSLKQIKAANVTSTGQFIMPAIGDPAKQKTMSATKSMERFQPPVSTKFQKLLASKYNQGFQSALSKDGNVSMMEHSLLQKSRMQQHRMMHSMSSQSQPPMVGMLDSQSQRPVSVQIIENQDEKSTYLNAVIGAENNQAQSVKDNTTVVHSERSKVDLSQISGIQQQLQQTEQTISPRYDDIDNEQMSKQQQQQQQQQQSIQSSGPTFNRISHNLTPSQTAATNDYGLVQVKKVQPVEAQLNNNGYSKNPSYVFFTNKQITESNGGNDKQSISSMGGRSGSLPVYRGEAFLAQSKQQIQNYESMSKLQNQYQYQQNIYQGDIDSAEAEVQRNHSQENKRINMPKIMGKKSMSSKDDLAADKSVDLWDMRLKHKSQFAKAGATIYSTGINLKSFNASRQATSSMQLSFSKKQQQKQQFLMENYKKNRNQQQNQSLSQNTSSLESRSTKKKLGGQPFKQVSTGSKDTRIQLAALFQPRDIRRTNQYKENATVMGSDKNLSRAYENHSQSSFNNRKINSQSSNKNSVAAQMLMNQSSMSTHLGSISTAGHQQINLLKQRAYSSHQIMVQMNSSNYQQHEQF